MAPLQLATNSNYPASITSANNQPIKLHYSHCITYIKTNTFSCFKSNNCKFMDIIMVLYSSMNKLAGGVSTCNDGFNNEYNAASWKRVIMALLGTKLNYNGCNAAACASNG
eukprot:274365_1